MSVISSCFPCHFQDGEHGLQARTSSVELLILSLPVFACLMALVRVSEAVTPRQNGASLCYSLGQPFVVQCEVLNELFIDITLLRLTWFLSISRLQSSFCQLGKVLSVV